MRSAYDVLRYDVVPPLFVVGFTCGVQWLALVGAGAPVTLPAVLERGLGNAFTWAATGVMLAWSLLSLRLPGPSTHGPPTPSGFIPTYKDNGVMYYWASTAAFACVLAWWPDLAERIYKSQPEMLGALNVVALTLCFALLCVGKLRVKYGPGEPRRPLVYEFFRGMEVHPRMMGVDVKQWTNCRVGLMLWQLLLIAFHVAGVRRNGFNAATLVVLILQSIYLAKFFYWEAGYFHTLDITLDRAGYYICWGCLVWVPCLYTFSSYYMVSHPPTTAKSFSLTCLVMGVLCILLNYRVDYEKQVFRSAADGKCQLWGRPAEFLEVEHVDAEGRVRKSKLLLSGLWGMARHLNYSFEILAALAWSLPAKGLGPLPFLYFFFLTVLLVHRTFRDEEKCRAKYGDGWLRYCDRVPYRLLPGIF